MPQGDLAEFATWSADLILEVDFDTWAIVDILYYKFVIKIH